MEAVQAPALCTFVPCGRCCVTTGIVARGYRLNPWQSPYLRWRFETFLGPEAAGLDAGKFFHLMWKYPQPDGGGS